MITLRKSRDRGATKIGWLDSRHTFSFGEYYDPAMSKLRPPARHQRGLDCGRRGLSAPSAIATWRSSPTSWTARLQHKDSSGGGGVIRPGEIQRMSAGRGIVHAEFNASASERTAICCRSGSCRPRRGIEPSYEQKTIDPQAVHNKFARIAAPDPRPNEVRLVQDAEIWAAKLDADSRSDPSAGQGPARLAAGGEGRSSLGDETLNAGDAAAITDQDQVALRARAERSAVV